MGGVRPDPHPVTAADRPAPGPVREDASPPAGERAVTPAPVALFAAVNLLSDPIHGYIELTKRLGRDQARALGYDPEPAAEEDVLDTPWLQRMRRISQLQTSRWVFPTAEHSRFTHGLGVMHEAGLWGRRLYPSLREDAERAAPGEPVPSEGLVVETMRLAGLLHDVGHGPFAHFFDDHVLVDFPAPPDPRRPAGKPLSHEDLGQLIIERELADVIEGLRRAPGEDAGRAAFGPGESIDPRWISFLISKPRLVDPGMPHWVRRLQPLLSGVFTVDNLDYVRRDAYLTGVSVGPVDVERLRRYCFIGPAGLTIYEPGLGALEMFLSARLFMYQQVYFHRAVRAIDLDLREVFGPSVRALVGEGSPADALSAYADLDEYALLHQAALWSRGEMLSPEPRPGDGTVTPAVGALWRNVLLRRPRWRAEREVRAEYEPDAFPTDLVASLGDEVPGEVVIDLAIVDARPEDATQTDALLSVAGRDGRPAEPVSRALARLPAWALVGRRYVRRTDPEPA